MSYVDPSGHGTESAPDKWAENNRKDIQDLVDEINHGNGASPGDIDAIKSLAKEFGLDPGEFDVKSSKEVNQQALKDLVDEVNQAGGASPSEKKILKEFAEEYGMDYDGLGVKEAGGSGSGGSSPKYGDQLVVSDQKMYQQGDHYNKHGRDMGYVSKKDYEAGARVFIEDNKNSAEIFEGVWNSSRGGQSGQTQIIIRSGGKQVIINKSTGQIIDFYVGTSLDGFINIRQVQ